MSSSPEVVVNAYYAAWLARDIPGVLSQCAANVRISQHFEDPELPFAGTTIGPAALAQRLELIFAAWTFEQATQALTSSDGPNVRTKCTFSVRHIGSGEVFEGSFRHVWVVREGLVTQIEEYLDVARLKSFLRLMGVVA